MAPSASGGRTSSSTSSSTSASAAQATGTRDAVDYVDVARVVNEVSDSRQFTLLEALATTVAEELERRFKPERIRVSVRKPEVRPAGLDGTVGVTVTRP